VLDFGVAKVMADSALAMPSARTVGNLRMFAPAYGAPEQFDGRVGAVGPSTDVYALALVALEALSDRTVMEGNHVGEFAALALDAARRPTPRRLGIAVGDQVEAVFARAVELHPTSRPSDAGEFWGMLKHAAQLDAQSRRPSLSHGSAAPWPALPQGERASSANSPALDAAHPQLTLPDLSARGGTLRVEQRGAEQRGASTNPFVGDDPKPPDARVAGGTSADAEPVVGPPRARAPAVVLVAVLLLALGILGIALWHAFHPVATQPLGRL
jgi:hypothetical protein